MADPTSIPLTDAPDAALMFPTLRPPQIARIAAHGVVRPLSLIHI